MVWRRAPVAFARRRGTTLIEILIVLALIALIMSAVTLGAGQMSSSRMRHSATMITGAIRVAFARATSTSKAIRLVMDFGDNTTPSAIWLEEGDQAHVVTSDKSGTGGAAAETQQEQAALQESGRILAGPTKPRTSFREIEPMGLVASQPGKGHKLLDTNIKFRRVQTGHDAEEIKEGRAYLYFWPGGQTERASIQLRVGNDDREDHAVTLLVQPLTGRVTVKPGAVAVPNPLDDKEASERTDPGAF